MRRLVIATAVLLGLAAPLASPALSQGVLRAAVGTSLAQLDPARTSTGDEYIYVHLVFNGLTRIEPDLTVQPDLAVSWTASDDLKVWTFKLREGVRFHHGRTLEAEDVVATMKHILDPGTGSRARSFLTMVDKVEAVDPLTVRFTLNIAYAGFADIFGERQMRIVAHDRLATVGSQPVGTGPFMFKSWAPGDRMELVKNPDYFEKGLPKLDGVTIVIIPEPAARLAALESRSIDLLWALPYEAVEKYQNHPVVRTDSVATASWDAVAMNNDRAPFNDVRVRQAFAAMIDRQTIVDLVLFGQGAPTHTPIPPNHPYFNKALTFKAPDVARAKKLLAEAGYPNGFEVTMQVPNERETRARLGVVVRDMVRPAGIRVNIERVPFATFSAKVSGKETLYTDGFFARPSADTSLYPFYHSTGSFNSQIWNYKNKRVDEILEEARRTNEEGKRKALFEELQSIIDETVPGVVAYALLHVNGVGKHVEGFRSTPMQWFELKGVTVKR